MKKLTFLITILAFFAQNASASGIFIGADALFANASHKAKNITANSTLRNGDVKEADNLNYGLNAGIRANLLVLMASAEVFYDNLNLSATNFAGSNGNVNVQDSVELKNRYGAKANVGFMILPNITPFVTYGLAKVRYSSNVLSAGNALTKTELEPLYGVGVLVDVPFIDLTAKLSYDYQSFDMRYADNSAKVKTHLGVAKLGVVYNF